MRDSLLPSYFEEYQDGSGYWYSIGSDVIYGMLTVDENVCRYTFNGGDVVKTEERQFSSGKAAQRFAAKFGAEMRRCDKRNTVPVTRDFRNF